MEGPITIAIIAITSLVSWRAFENHDLFHKLKNNPFTVKHSKEYYRIFSHALIHGDWMHLFFNMFVIYGFGSQIEMVFTNSAVFNLLFPNIPFWGNALGILYFLILYIMGIAVATLPSLQKHGDDFGYNSVGASGGVSAIMMAYMIMFPLSEVAFFFIPMPGYIAVPVFFLLEYVMGKSRKTNIAHDAHIWGALFGIAFIFALNVDFLTNFIRVVRIAIGL
jgi:membrane associated rhomboid family serine protease